MSLAQNLYFIALTIPDALGVKITEIKTQFKQHFGSKAALRSPPHITLHMPYRVNSTKHERISRGLLKLSTTFHPFDLKLENFGAFPPRVIYIKVIENPYLLLLQKEIAELFRRNLSMHSANFRGQPFHPHVTVAFRDLSKPNFRQAWEIYRNEEFEGKVGIKDITCLKHDGKLWHSFQKFPLTGLS